MKYITDITNIDQINQLTSRFNLSTFKENVDAPSDPIKYEVLRDIARFVIDSMRQLIPNNIDDFFSEKYNEAMFLDDLTEHLTVSSLLSKTYINPSFIIKNNQRFCDDFANLTADEDQYNKKIKSYKIKLENYVRQQLRLNTSERTQTRNQKKSLQVDIPFDYFPYILFLTYNYDFHQKIKSNEIDSESIIIERVEAFLDILNEYRELSNDSESELFDKPHEFIRLDDNQLDVLMFINNVMFEREFDLMISSEILNYIVTLHESINQELRLSITNTLCLISLFPNVISRSKLINWVDTCISRYPREYKVVKSNLSGLQDLFLQLALVTIPMMESYICYLLQHSPIEVDIHKILFNIILPKNFDLQAFTQINGIIQKAKSATEGISVSATLDAENVRLEKIKENHDKYLAAKIEMTHLHQRIIKVTLGF